MKQTTDLVQLFRDFFMLIIEVQEVLADETIREFLMECEGYSLQEANKSFPVDYDNLISETKEYAAELKWYIKNYNNAIIYQTAALQKLVIYRNRSLGGLTTIKRDIESTKDDQRKHFLTKILSDLIIIFNELLVIAREAVENTHIANQTNWIGLYELSEISLEDL